MDKFFTWLGTNLVPEWRTWWKLRSIQLGILFSAALAYLAANPDAFTKLEAELPEPLRASMPAWLPTVAAGVIFFARFWKQNAVTPAPVIAADPAVIVPPSPPTLVPALLMLLLLGGMLTGLTGCASLSDSNIEQTVCSHQIVTTEGAEAALKAAQLIQDPAARDAAFAAANATLALVAGCPGYVGPMPTAPAS